MLPEQLDPEFMKFCFWLSFMAVASIAVCLPMICVLLFLVVENTKVQRNSFLRGQNQIADELQKLRSELKNRRASEKDQ
jgi:hypothetical protein